MFQLIFLWIILYLLNQVIIFFLMINPSRLSPSQVLDIIFLLKMATPPEQPDIEMQEAEEEDFLIEEHPRLFNVDICKILIFKTLSTLSDLDQTQKMYQWLMYLS